MPKIFYTGPGPDGLDAGGYTFVRDGEGVDVDDELAKSLLEREDFQKSAPSRQSPKVETTKDKE